MQSKITSLCLAFLVAFVPSIALSQVNTINNFSVYSMYGLGELQTQGTLSTRSMGGAGVATRNYSSINLLNPASYSMALPRGVLFDFGLDGSIYMGSQEIDGELQRSNYTSANFRNISLQLPVTKGLGVGFSISPYSSVGYHEESAVMSDNYDYVNFVNEGSGDITEVKLGVGWQITKRLSVGFAGQYYWGDISRTFEAQVTPLISSGSPLSSYGIDNYSVSRIKGQFGVQWSPIVNMKRSLSFGATYDIGGDLSPRYSRVVEDSYGYVQTQSDTTSLKLVIPRQLAVGATYATEKVTLAFDYSYQNWGDINDGVEYTGDGIAVTYNNVNQLRFGLEYIPRRADVRHYYRRMSYRMGANYGGYQYTYSGTKIAQYAVTGGVGLPISMIGISKLDFGIEWGGIGSRKNIVVDNAKIGLVKQNYIKFAFGVTMFGDDYWFQRPQID